MGRSDWEIRSCTVEPCLIGNGPFLRQNPLLGCSVTFGWVALMGISALMPELVKSTVVPTLLAALFKFAASGY